jgi:hypothetical protein
MTSHRAWTTAGIDRAAYDTLARTLPASELWSLLLHVYASRANQRSPAALLRQYARDPFVSPSSIDQRVLVELDGHLLAAAEGFEAIELSPLAPLGACSAIALASQHKVVSALRGTEVVSDPTNVLALESARRLRGNPADGIHLATCHRCVRAQAAPKLPGFAQHFRTFCLASAGPERKDRAFLVEALVTHITTHLRALIRLERHGYRFPERRVSVLTTPANDQLGDRVAAAITDTPVTRTILEHPYYDGVRFRIDVDGPDRSSWPLVDGGAFDWVRVLASNRKLAFVASGIGAQLAAHAFRRGGETLPDRA